MLPQNKHINTPKDDTFMPPQNKLILIPGDGYCCYHVMLLHLLLIVKGRDSLIQATNDTISQLENLGAIRPGNLKEFLKILGKFPEAYKSLLDRINSPEYLQNSENHKCEFLDDRLQTIKAQLYKQQQFLSRIEETRLIRTMLPLLDADITSLSNQAAPILRAYFTSSRAKRVPELDNSYKRIFVAFLQSLHELEGSNALINGAQFPNALVYLQASHFSWASLDSRYYGTDEDLAIYRKCFFEAIEDPTDYLGYEMRIQTEHFDAIFKVVGNKPSALLQTMQANLTEQDICSLPSSDNIEIDYVGRLDLKHHSFEGTNSHKTITSPSTTPKKTEAINAALDDNNASLRKQIKKDYIVKVGKTLNKFIKTYNENSNISGKSIKHYIEEFKKEYKSIKQFDEAGNLTRKQLDDIMTRCENLNKNICRVANGKGPKNSL